ncbi:MAG: sugar ABC transporter permease [Puniceicoccaceae bacterium]|nr:MAG: sugar ABC transporter permease [Puniceicoccaceae bacterium]
MNPAPPTQTAAATAAGVPARLPGPPPRKRFQRTWMAAYFFLIPYILLTLVFFLYPFFNAVVLAFHQTNGPYTRVFVGWANFAFVLGDPTFYLALKNTAIFAVFSVFLQLPLSLGLALLLNQGADKIKGFFRLAIFSPHLVGQIFVGVLFSVLFVPRYGLVNRFLHELLGWGLENRWLENPALVMPAIILTALWMYVGFNMIYFLAALQNVDQNLREAAMIDGAGPWQRFLNVTLPAIKPVATFVVVMSTIGSFQLFELPYALLDGFGPANSGLTVVGYLYQYAFNTGDLGTGATVGWILALVIFIVSLVQIRISQSMKGET